MMAPSIELTSVTSLVRELVLGQLCAVTSHSGDVRLLVVGSPQVCYDGPLPSFLKLSKASASEG